MLPCTCRANSWKVTCFRKGHKNYPKWEPKWTPNWSQKASLAALGADFDDFEGVWEVTVFLWIFGSARGGGEVHLGRALGAQDQPRTRYERLGGLSCPRARSHFLLELLLSRYARVNDTSSLGCACFRNIENYKKWKCQICLKKACLVVQNDPWQFLRMW